MNSFRTNCERIWGVEKTPTVIGSNWIMYSHILMHNLG